MQCGGGACSADLTSDSRNCGDCGNACAGSTCGAGSCQPVETLATRLNFPGAVAVDSSNAYFAQDDLPRGTVLSRVPLAGGTVQVLAHLTTQAQTIHVDPSGVYASDLSGVVRVAPGGNAAITPVVSDAAFLPGAVAFDSGSVWWLRATSVPDVGAGGSGTGSSMPVDLVRQDELALTPQVVATGLPATA